ncbi:hypothetical protein B0H63DRAFT_75188 [Podospora didyma]|uniref:Uncharacterized protein n=1 Tax=Podospora didyma TaxID=330526 RepID=A0AAE0N2C4_9PEZI|nr:hypothetical protein B0H63DRAFT_75188 [Podospora didyma]
MMDIVSLFFPAGKCQGYPLLPLFVLLSSAVPFAKAQCGSLITYRQHEILLSSAPACLQNGCGVPSPAESMSSICPLSSPCSVLWEIMRVNWQPDWCGQAASLCPGDVACRIWSWPILNATAACSATPNDWLFSATNTGGCCAAGDEPFMLSDWVALLCNGSAWREPFVYYGGMAPLDWAEWIEPWNWTVSPRDDALIQHCPSSASMLASFAEENLISLGEIILQTALYWMFLQFNFRFNILNRLAMRQVHRWERSLVGGVLAGISVVVSNFLTAVQWSLTPGYSNIPIGYLGLLLCARPSAIGLLCFLDMLLSDWLARKIAGLRTRFHPREAADPIRDNADRHVHGLPDSPGEGRAKQFLANLAMTMAVAEVIIQISSLYSLYKTAVEGGHKGFYQPEALTPFWRGHEALWMYAGALLHCIFSWFSFFSLVACAVVQAYRIWIFDHLSGHLMVAMGYQRRKKTINRLVDAIKKASKKKKRPRQQQQQQQQQQESGQTEAQTSAGTQQQKQEQDSGQTQGQRPTETKEENPPPVAASYDPNFRATEGPDLPEQPTWVGRVFATWPFSAIFKRLEKMALRAEQRQRPSRQALELISKALRRFENGTLSVTFLCVIVNYISQWIFWAGFVESQGDRWCPPKYDLKLLIWFALTFIALVFSIIFSKNPPPGAQA